MQILKETAFEKHIKECEALRDEQRMNIVETRRGSQHESLPGPHRPLRDEKYNTLTLMQTYRILSMFVERIPPDMDFLEIEVMVRGSNAPHDLCLFKRGGCMVSFGEAVPENFSEVLQYFRRET